ncbi:MAG: hypothetical protein H3C47_02700 [Candidatus Cloacimonetes bacterium]|nr:hypothetical protein [Candidatus Cloacimonadota bacterium]
MSLIRHFLKFRFVFYYLICLWLAGFIRSLVLDLDRSLQVDKRIVERVLTEHMQKYAKAEDHSGAKHGIQISSAAQAEVSSGELSFRIQVGGAQESELSRLKGEYKKGGQRTDWLRANHTWFLWVHRCLPLILFLHFVWYIRPASLVNRLIGRGVVVEDSLRFLGRARLLNLSRIAMLHGLILAILYGCVQFGAEYYLMPFPLDRYFLIPFSSLAYALAFCGMVIGLFDPLILSLVPRYCKGHEIYQARTEAWFPGIAFRLRILVASAVIMPFTVLFLSQFVYNPLLRSAWNWIISEDHNPAIFAEMLPDLMNAGIAVFVLMVALIIGVTVGRGIFRSLAEPLESLAARMELVGSGDFSQRSSVLAMMKSGEPRLILIPWWKAFSTVNF